MKTQIIFRVLLIFLLLLYTKLIYSQIIYVKHDAIGINDGTSWQNAFTDLQDALTISTDNDMIWIAAGIYHPGGQSPDSSSIFAVHKSIFIYGGFNGTEISLEERDPVVNVTILSGDINEDDILDDFTSNKSDNTRHVIYVDSLLDLVIMDGFTFQGGHTGNDMNGTMYETGGGGAYVLSPVSFSNCNFQNNFGRFGACLLLTGGASHSSIEHCTFTNNQGTFRSAGIFTTLIQDVVVKHCSFMNNQTRSGALYPLSCSNVLIDSCFFKDNHNDFTNGGALFSGQNKNVLISNCNFIQNSASNGGAIDIDGRNIPIDSLSLTRIENCRFEGNTSVNRGSAIYCNANPDILIRRCVFIDNAADIGGAVTIQQPELNATDTTRVRIDSCRFRNNSTTNQDFGGGALFLFQTAAKIENCNFESNFSNGLTFSAGGHILAYGPQRHFIFRADTLSNGISHGYGGAVTTLGPGAQYFFENCLFKENESDQFGGAIYNALAATTILKDCTFQENKSLGNSGGAIALQDDSSRLVVQRSVFRQNSAGIHGGSIYTDGGSNTVDIDQSLFESNEAGASGGAIYMSERAGSEGSKLTLSNSWLGFNFSVAEGGAISNKDVDAQIVSSVIYQNSCSGSGLGGTLVLIASGQDTMLTEITNATIVDNHGGLADGLVQYSLSFDTSNIAYIKNCIFRNRGTTNYYKEIGVPILESRGGNMSDDSSLLEVLTHKKDLNLTEPIFTDTITNDYSLESISPGIDDGVEENAPEFDILGLPRVNAPDMGAYENQFPVNVKEIIPSKVEDIIVSPNPASGKSAEIIMNNSWIGSMELRIISLSGAVMKMQKVYKPAEIYRFIISLDGLSPAVYQVIVSNGEEVRLKKLIRI